MKPKLLFVALTVFFGLASFGSATAQKQVDFIHGLQGSSKTWEYYNYFQYSYHNASFRRLDYKSVGSISGIAQGLQPHYSDKKQRIAVGHSMGGLVIKELIYRYSSAVNYGGFITIGTPHKGARIVNSIYNGGVDKIIKKIKDMGNTCAGIIEGSLLALAANLFKGRNIPQELRKAAEPLENTKNMFAGDLARSLGEGSPDIEGAYGFGKELNKRNMPMIAIYGEERHPQMYRLGATKKSRDEGKMSESEYFDEYKEKYENLFCISSLAYVQSAIYAGAATGSFFLGAWLNPYFYYYTYRAGEMIYAGVTLNKLGNYLKNDIHNEWSYLIGAYRTERHSYVYYKWVCSQINRTHPKFHYWNHKYDNNFDDPFLYRVGFCTKGKMTKVIKHYTLRIRESSDGLLNKTTQTAQPGALLLDAKNVNHLNETKHYNVRERLRQAFSGDVVDALGKDKKYHYFKLKK